MFFSIYNALIISNIKNRLKTENRALFLTFLNTRCRSDIPFDLQQARPRIGFYFYLKIRISPQIQAITRIILST